MQVCKYASVPVCKCASVQMCKCANMQVCKCASVQICKYANLQVCQPVQSLNVCQLFSVSTRLMAIGLVIEYIDGRKKKSMMKIACFGLLVSPVNE